MTGVDRQHLWSDRRLDEDDGFPCEDIDTVKDEADGATLSLLAGENAWE
jgi:hypothetical protein